VVVRTADRMGFGDLFQLHALHRPELKFAPFTPHTLWRVRRGSRRDLRPDPFRRRARAPSVRVVQLGGSVSCASPCAIHTLSPSR
jgi:hypothetical protein